MAVKTVTIRSGTFRCDLYLTPELGTLPVTNWRKLLRLAMEDRDPWAAWYEENGKALREIRHYFLELVSEADLRAKQAESTRDAKTIAIPRKCDPVIRAQLRNRNACLQREASDARRQYDQLLKLLTVFIEETQNYVL